MAPHADRCLIGALPQGVVDIGFQHPRQHSDAKSADEEGRSEHAEGVAQCEQHLIDGIEDEAAENHPPSIHPVGKETGRDFRDEDTGQQNALQDEDIPQRQPSRRQEEGTDRGIEGETRGDGRDSDGKEGPVLPHP